MVTGGLSPEVKSEEHEGHNEELERWEQEQIKKGTSVPQVMTQYQMYAHQMVGAEYYWQKEIIQALNQIFSKVGTFGSYTSSTIWYFHIVDGIYEVEWLIFIGINAFQLTPIYLSSVIYGIWYKS